MPELRPLGKRTLAALSLLPLGLVGAQPTPALAQAAADASTASSERPDGQHDFDFEFGAWSAELSRRLNPLTGSDTWVEYEGTSFVRRVWNGRANLGELDVEGPEGRIEGLTLRLYNPEVRQWHISWANSRDGMLGEAMVGQFEYGRGEFYNQEMFGGRAVLVRFIFSDVTDDSFRFEQAFSDDGGRTWEPNWIATFAHLSED
jgi:hypothetical protein